MKTLISFILLLISGCCSIFAETSSESHQIELSKQPFDPDEILLPLPRTPEVIPQIYFDGNTLYFATPCDGCTLQIVDEAENICYELVIPMGTTELDLPENLFGEYELRIIRGNTLYYGTININ